MNNLTDKHVVVIGGVAGGATFATRLRRLSENVKITIFERGPYISYANCALPYYIGDIVTPRNALLLQTPNSMKQRYNIDVQVNSTVTSIKKDEKIIKIKTLSGEEFTQSYDQLVIATGSSVVKPPIKGVDLPEILPIWTVPDTDRIKEHIQRTSAKHAVVVGGGFIGIEMAENLKLLGLEVEIVDLADQVLGNFDYEMASLLHLEIANKGVKLHLKQKINSFYKEKEKVVVELENKVISTDFVVLSTGIKPNSELAKEAGLEIGERGGIVVNNKLTTSDPFIHAVGDVIQVKNLVDDTPALIPLAGPANKQGRILANILAGLDDEYKGSLGTSIVKVFDFQAASVGYNEKALIKKGLEKGKDYETVLISQNAHAGYYPNNAMLTLKLIFNLETKKIYGAQIIGEVGADKRIDTIATVMKLGGTINDLAELELAYAPPYNSAKDPVNMLGFTALNVIDGLENFATWDSVENNPDWIVLDVREESEIQTFSVENSVNISLQVLRENLNKLNKDSHYIIMCAIGVRAHFASQILRNNGFKNVKIYPGGSRFYRITHS